MWTERPCERLSSDELIHAERLAGPVSDQIDGAVAFVAQFMRPALDARSTRGADAPVRSGRRRRRHRQRRRPPRLLHLRLEDPPVPVADRIEFYSPGGLPNTITLDEMPYRTFTRNQLLVGFLSRIRSKRAGQVFLESRGEGVPAVIALLRQLAPATAARDESAYRPLALRYRRQGNLQAVLDEQWHILWNQESWSEDAGADETAARCARKLVQVVPPVRARVHG